MFSNSKKSQSMTNGKSSPSIISADITIKGNLVSKGEVQLNGVIEGDVEAVNLIVGEGARITGEVRARTILIKGEVRGSVHCQAVELTRTAVVHGDIYHDSLSIESGAQLEGMCRRNVKDNAPKLELAASNPAKL